MAQIKNKLVLLTGAASGIGRCAVDEFAKAGARLIITDINQEALEQTADELRNDFNAEVYSYCVDVSNREQVENMAKDVLLKHGKLDVLVNNAGIGHSGEMVETPIEKWQQLVNINFWGPLYHVYAFLPSMMKAKSGHIVNVSSGQAYFRLPTWGPYATIKLALGAFSEILRFEVKKFGIKVTTVYPFMVNTPFYKDIEGDTFAAKLSMKLVPYYSMSPERVGRILFKAVKKQKPVEMVSVFNDVAFLTRTLPPLSSVISKATIMLLGKNTDELEKQL